MKIRTPKIVPNLLKKRDPKCLKKAIPVFFSGQFLSSSQGNSCLLLRAIFLSASGDVDTSPDVSASPDVFRKILGYSAK